jgi:hypothetical protein
MVGSLQPGWAAWDAKWQPWGVTRTLATCGNLGAPSPHAWVLARSPRCIQNVLPFAGAFGTKVLTASCRAGHRDALSLAGAHEAITVARERVPGGALQGVTSSAVSFCAV